MPIIPVAPPQTVSTPGGFDYVTVDAVRRRVYAAHGGANSLLVLDADKGTVLGQVTVGPMHGVAVDPASGHVYTGDGDNKTVSEVDPVAMSVVRKVDVGAAIDAIALDAANGKIYADEDDGTKLVVVDAKTFKVLGNVALPGHKPEYLAVDPVTHDVYQNIDDLAEVAVVDSGSLKVARTFKTPELQHNHPLQYDAAYKYVVTGGNGVLSVYDQAGTKKFQIEMPKRIDQCDLDQTNHMLACGGNGGITLVQLANGAAPKIVGTLAVNPGVHTLAIDPKTHNIWAVWSDPATKVASVQRFSYQP